MDHIRRVVIGLGSNLGDRKANIAQALDRLNADEEIHLGATSPLYETAPEGGPRNEDGSPAQGPFLNGAVLVLTSIDAGDLLVRLQRIESELGRRRGVPNGPRTIDLDILWIEGESIASAELVVPHPRLLQRAFMLRPLLDVADDASHSETGQVFAEHELAKTELRRAG